MEDGDLTEVLIAMIDMITEQEIEVIELALENGELNLEFITDNIDVVRGRQLSNLLFIHRQELKENKYAIDLFVLFNENFDAYCLKHFGE